MDQRNNKEREAEEQIKTRTRQETKKQKNIIIFCLVKNEQKYLHK